MKGKGLTMEGIVDAATELVVEKGYNNFSVRELAQRLHVKAASLYNHVKSIDDVNREIGKRAAQELNDVLERAAAGKERDGALRSLAYEYRSFVKQNYELYRAVIGLPSLDEDGSMSVIGRESVRIIRHVIEQYEVEAEAAVHFSRCFRSALHGFVLLEKAGYFTGKNMAAEDSFQFMVDGYIAWAAKLLEIRGKEGGAGKQQAE